MNWLVTNKKLAIIIFFVFFCGLILQFSRSDFILNSTKNVTTISKNPDLLIPVTKSYEVASDASYCIVYNEESQKLKDNIAQTLNYIQKPYKTFDVYLGKVDYTNCPNILLTTNSLQHLGSIEEIEAYVLNSGNLFLMRTLEPDTHFQVLHRALGIIDYQGFTSTEGIHLLSNVLIGAKNKTFLENNIDDSSLALTLDHTIEPLVVNTNNNPILWKTNFGKGKIMTLNGGILFEKVARGFIVGMLSEMDQHFIYPIFNMKTFYIDDFPAPLPQGRHAIIYDEFKQDTPTFFQNIWWPDMLEVASNTNIIYTGAFIETYNDQVSPPFEQITGNDINYLIRFGRELTLSKGEIGLHGYNHQSLTLDANTAKAFGYNTWASTDHMKDAINEAISYVNRAFPAYDITSYVPPSNVLSLDGRRALKEAVPSLVTIASLYGEDGSNLAYVQEFEIAEDGVVEMPRISSGYSVNPIAEWEIVNAITSLGVFSHFIHPDDVISKDRSQGTWTQMYKSFEHYMEDTYEIYPWLEAMTATDAAYKVANTLHNRVSFTSKTNEIIGTMEQFYEPQSFILKTAAPVRKVKNGDFEKIDDNTYLITAFKKNFTISLKEDAT